MTRGIRKLIVLVSVAALFLVANCLAETDVID